MISVFITVLGVCVLANYVLMSASVLTLCDGGRCLSCWHYNICDDVFSVLTIIVCDDAA